MKGLGFKGRFGLIGPYKGSVSCLKSFARDLEAIKTLNPKFNPKRLTHKPLGFRCKVCLRAIECGLTGLGFRFPFWFRLV